MTNKIIGWLLLFLGVAVIAYSLYSSFSVFTAKKPVPEIFSVEQLELEEKLEPQQGLEAQAEEMIRKELERMIPIDFLPQFFNLISWSLLAGILIFGGSKIAGLGIKLIKIKNEG